MTDRRRTPYTTRGLPRTDEPTHQVRQRIAELDAENEALVKQSIERAEENSALRQRLGALRPEYVEGLEAAARKVCGAAPGPIQRLAIKDLCRLVASAGQSLGEGDDR